MNEINPANLNKTNFKGIQKMNKDISNEVKTLESGIKEMVQKLYKAAERSQSVPEYGEFEPVYIQIANPDKTLCATDFMLKISKPPKNIEGHEKIRNLEVVAYKLPAPYKAERIIATGSKGDIMAQLKSNEIYEKIQNAAKSLSSSLEDV